MINSEFNKLKTVLIYCPGKEIDKIKSPGKVLFKAPVLLNKLRTEFEEYISVLSDMEVEVKLLNPGNNEIKGIYNLMYMRDLLFMTPYGAVVSNMACNIRKREPYFIEKFFEKERIPVLKKISGKGTFECADALWLNKNTVIVGVGKRT